MHVAPGGEEARGLLWKAWEKLFPAAAYLYGAQAGFAASVVVFTTYMLRKARGRKARSIEEMLEEDERRAIRLSREIKRLRGELEYLRKAAQRYPENKSIQLSIKVNEDQLRSLERELDLVSLRIIAVRKLLFLGDTGLLQSVEEVVEKIYSGRLEESQYLVLREMQSKLDSKELDLVALRKIVEY